tara:strand:+ start:601 stop:4401 length:3801 start_codon:yes stop_codon:yes gene_type:complete
MSFCLHCRFPLRDIAHKYKLARVLGRGGAGTVYLAHHIRLAQHNERVIKIITTPRRTEELEARFYQEVQITASLSQSNDHIVRIYDDFGYEKGLGYYYVMEYLQGQSLRELLDQQGALRPDVALPLFHQICMGIIAAHREGVIHRDLKPENVQIIRRPDIPLFAKVIDFGIAYTLTEDAAHITKGLIGTPQYMSPEQCLDKPIDQRTDIYAMGVVLYEMLTGATPFITDNTPSQSGNFAVMFAHVWNEPQPMRRRWPTLAIPDTLDDIVLKMLAKDPNHRYNTLQEVLHEILQVMELPPSTALPSLQNIPALDNHINTPRSTAQRLTSVPYHTTQASSPYDALNSMERMYLQKSNLKESMTPFIGRAEELQRLTQLFTEGHRLVTLLGPGGTGKSRLATEYGRAQIEQRDGGVWFCDLTEAHNLRDLLSAVATPLQIQLSNSNTNDAIQQIGYALRSRGDTLILMDNFEQVLQHAPQTLGVWMTEAPQATFLLTSRERLRLPGEHPFDLPPLPEDEALELFKQRAKAVRADFEIDDSNRETLLHIVERLDKLPLAIELAAARVNILSPDALLDRLDKRFQLLSSGRKELPQRQATLRGAIDWSWELLEDYEQETFSQCAIFQGGFTLEAAEAILDSQFEDAPWILDRIEALKDKSLLRFWKPSHKWSDTRFGMYESIREYAAEKLKKSEQRDDLAKRHAAYYLKRGSELSQGVYQHGGVKKLHKLFEESRNIRGIYKRFKEDDPLLALQALLVLEPVYSMKGSRQDYLEMLRPLLSLDQKETKLEHIKGFRIQAEILRRVGQVDEAHKTFAFALHAAKEQGHRAEEGDILNRVGNLTRLQGDKQGAKDLHLEAMKIFKSLDDKRGEAISLGHLGNIHRLLGHLDAAEEFHLRALSLQQETGDRRGEGIALGQLGNLYRIQGRLHEANRYYGLALKIHRELGDRNGEGIDLNNLGNLLMRQGRLREAEKHYKKALDIHRRSGDRRGEGIASGQLGNLYRMKGDFHKAEPLQRNALQLQRTLDDKRGEGIGLNNLGNLYRSQGHYREAEHHYQQAIEIHKRHHDRMGEGFSLLYLGILYLEEQRYLDASRSLQQALTQFSKRRVKGPQGTVLSHLGTWHRLEGRTKEAIQCYMQALGLLEKKDRREEARTRALLGSLHADMDKKTAAINSFQIAQQLLENYEDPLSKAVLDISRGHLDLSYMREAIKFREQAAADTHKQAAQEKLDLVNKPDYIELPSSAQALSMAACSSELRIAIQCLERALHSRHH